MFTMPLDSSTFVTWSATAVFIAAVALDELATNAFSDSASVPAAFAVLEAVAEAVAAEALAAASVPAAVTVGVLPEAPPESFLLLEQPALDAPMTSAASTDTPPNAALRPSVFLMAQGWCTPGAPASGDGRPGSARGVTDGQPDRSARPSPPVAPARVRLRLG
ncbi:hypothetical protein GCM10009759_37260 [Kitasatospora saccharophila]|uniref:Secreted protein n=1 Tax=Kitasatospora saccharophila TaxID=407973 RepID=A0ABN2X0Y8_9ACTN